MATGASPAVVSQLSDVVPPAAVTVDPARSAVPSYSAHAAPATTPSSGPRIGARLRWLVTLRAGGGTAGQVVVVHHGQITWTPGARHTWCTHISLSERGRLAGRFVGQRIAGRRSAQLTSSRVWAAEIATWSATGRQPTPVVSAPIVAATITRAAQLEIPATVSGG
ncbi:MAG: hypothetical protein M3319_12825 [Actinomycetota bacterium]|nr:hypothetical protein [Actinomycetota bacterium]